MQEATHRLSLPSGVIEPGDYYFQISYQRLVNRAAILASRASQPVIISRMAGGFSFALSSWLVWLFPKACQSPTVAPTGLGRSAPGVGSHQLAGTRLEQGPASFRILVAPLHADRPNGSTRRSIRHRNVGALSVPNVMIALFSNLVIVFIPLVDFFRFPLSLLGSSHPVLSESVRCFSLFGLLS